MKSKISALAVISALLLFPAFICAQTTEEITITTYYPSPYGVYKEMRLYPNNTPSTCNANNVGAMYYDSASSPAKTKVCKQTGSATYAWQDLSGWAVPAEIRATTGVHNGKFDNIYGGITNGYRGINEYVRRDSNCGNNFSGTSWHVCDGTELARYAQISGEINLTGWFASGLQYSATAGGLISQDCAGWSGDGSANQYGPVWSGTSVPDRPAAQICSTVSSVLCCR